MEKLKKLYKKLINKLPKSANTKITKSTLDRGGGGVFTARRKRNDKVLVPFTSFITNWNKSDELLTETFDNGYRVLCSPQEYFNNKEILTEIPTIVRYQTYEDLEKYPVPINWNHIKTNRKDYSDNEIMWVKDIKNLDKYAKKGKSTYVGPKHIGQHEMDYATDEEMIKVQMCLLFQMVNCVDFEYEMSDNPLYDEYLKYSENFKLSSLYLDNPKLQEVTTKYGNTVCPVMIQFPNIKKELTIIYFKDIVNGKVVGDDGREDFNRTFTKINLHHFERLISGKFNHNHKNVFLGTATGNGIDANLNMIGATVQNLI
jgi:hypothetical protein